MINAVNTGWASGTPRAAGQGNAPEGAFDLALALALGGAAAKHAAEAAKDTHAGTVQAPEEDRKKVDPTLCLMTLPGLNPASLAQEQPALQADPLQAGMIQDEKGNAQPTQMPLAVQSSPLDAAAAAGEAAAMGQAIPEGLRKAVGQGKEELAGIKASAPADMHKEPAQEQALLLKAEVQGKPAAQSASAGRESSFQARQDTEGKQGSVHSPGQAMQQAAALERMIPPFQAERPQMIQEAALLQSGAEAGPAAQVARATLEAVKNGVSEYRIRLKPEGLGQVEVTLKASGRTLYLDLRTDNQTVRDLILDKAAELRNELSAQDYQVGSLNVQVGAGGQNEAGFFAPPGENTAGSLEAGARERETPQPEQPNQAASRSFPARSGILNYRV